MNERKKEWMSECVLKSEWVNEWMYECVLKSEWVIKSECVNVWMSEWKSFKEWMNEWMSEWTRETYLGNADGDGFTLGGHQDNFIANLNTIRESQQTGNHQLGTIANSIHSRVLHHNLLMLQQQDFQRTDHTTQVFFSLIINHSIIHSFTYLSILIVPLGIQDIMHCHNTVVFCNITWTHTT